MLNSEPVRPDDSCKLKSDLPSSPEELKMLSKRSRDLVIDIVIEMWVHNEV